MTIAYWCVFVAAFLPYPWAMAWRINHYDLQKNLSPRKLQQELSGWRQRAHWAHLNALESFAPFAAIVIIAHLRAAPQAAIDIWASAYVGFRIAHGVFYLANFGVLRSLAFFASVVCIVVIFLLAL